MEFGDEEEIELSLGLGIGGSCKKRARSEDRMREVPARGEAEGKEGEEVDLARRREMQALRRQEARRKREEKKQMKRGGLRVVRRSLVNQQVDNGGRSVVYDGGNVDDVVALNREKIESDAAEGADQSSQFLQSENPAPACSSSAYAFPIYAYSSFQYVPFAFPCIAPVYKPESDATFKTAAEQTVSFRPFLGGAATVNGVKDEVNVTAISNGSVGCCSSAISENRSISSQDGSSSDSGSHRSGHKSAKRELHSSSGSDVPDGAADKADNAPPTTLFQTSSAEVRTQDTSAVEPKPANIPISRTTSLPQPKTPITKDNKVDDNSPGKPPRPVHNQEPRAAPSQMPCVSTTGNGPDGKTITGFLYRYSTTAEVSIVCVCHGESFSPAEFVKHAGGIDIIHPLRHITVVPSAF